MKKNQLSREITLVIALKLAAITILWVICFSHPQKPDINADKVAARLLG